MDLTAINDALVSFTGVIDDFLSSCLYLQVSISPLGPNSFRSATSRICSPP